MKANEKALMALGLPQALASIVGNTYGGVKTGITAAGTTISDATALTGTINVVETTASSTGVKLPAVIFDAQSPTLVFIYNAGAQTLTIYPEAATSTIGGSASTTLATTKTAMLYKASATAWYAVGLN